MIKYIYSGIKWGKQCVTIKLPDSAVLDLARDRDAYDSIDELIQECLEWDDDEDTGQEVYITKLTVENNTIKLEPKTFKVTRKVSYEFEVTNDGIGAY